MKNSRVIKALLLLSCLGVMSCYVFCRAGETTNFSFENPKTISFHTESSAVLFLLGTWHYKDPKNEESIEETWVKSSLDEITCIRIRRTFSYALQPRSQMTIPTERDQSLSPIEKTEIRPSLDKTAVQEKEIYTIKDGERGASVSIVKLVDSKIGFEKRFVGSLDQKDFDSVSINLVDIALNAPSSLTITYKKLPNGKLACVRDDGKEKREQLFERRN